MCHMNYINRTRVYCSIYELHEHSNSCDVIEIACALDVVLKHLDIAQKWFEYQKDFLNFSVIRENQSSSELSDTELDFVMYYIYLVVIHHSFLV